MKSIKKYLSLIKFSHTIFAMPFAMIGFFLAIKYADKNISPLHSVVQSNIFLTKLLEVVLCMIFARSAAMAFNRYLDKSFDAKNPRTAIREIPAGLIKANHVLVFTLVCCGLFIGCCWFINQLCFYLSFVAIAVILFYSYTKRFTALCHLVLGAGLSLAPIGAYLAVQGEFDALPLLFSFIVLFWVSGFDIIYALQDEAFDKVHLLHSIPAYVGKEKALIISRLLHAISILLVLFAGAYGHFGILYWVASAFFTGMIFYQHSLVRPDDLSKVDGSFMTANGMASLFFSILVILDLYFH